MKFILVLLLINLSACSYSKAIFNKNNYLDFNSISFEGKSYLLGNKYLDVNFSLKGIAKDEIGSCTTFSDIDNGVSYTFNKQKLVEILIKNENKSIYTSKKIRNGMNVKEIYKSYEGYEIKKMKSEGAGDSQDDFTYTVTDNLQKNNILIFDVVHGEIQGMHAGKRGFDLSDCEE
ncbi:hypothetical protein [Acinetobacter zhairhuonensis]|uniref:hypothetical protein n=1 Tax=Acinetobacter sp. A7.4 TaxID=2919921 RepID=UPI001F4F9CD6|nr:hypothetical protein [Acinetobacter sp. A7.4]MCJ8161489.1 hypothetical protein [Acinetobacter sp. A7.4]